MLFKIDDETVEADDSFEAACSHAVGTSGLEDDDVCWDPWSFTVTGPDGKEEDFAAEVASMDGECSGTVKVTNEAGEERLVEN